MIGFCALASGSNGNCYYIENNNEAVLIDAGISSKQILKRMNEKNINLSKIKALFITHEHSDHIRGVNVFSKKTKIPIFINRNTYVNSKINLSSDLINIIDSDSTTKVGNLVIKSFRKSHDGVEPVSFIVKYKSKVVSVLTDIGKPCENVEKAVNQSDIIFLETNYDHKMLEEGNYPYFLKQRILGVNGHLSNDDAFELVSNNSSSNLKYLILSHLSENHNDPSLVFDKFGDLNRKFPSLNIIITKRDDAIDLIRL